MNDLIFPLLRRHAISFGDLPGENFNLIIDLPRPKSVIVSRYGERLRVREAHTSCFFEMPKSSDDIDVLFHVEGQRLTPLEITHGYDAPKRTYSDDGGAISFKPISLERQTAFVDTWAKELRIRGIMRGQAQIAF